MMKCNDLVLLTVLAFAALPAQATAIALESAADFAVLGGSGVTNSGFSVINDGDVGASAPTALVTGFPPGVVNRGIIYTIPDPATAQAKTDLIAAFAEAQAAPGGVPGPADLGGATLGPGVYTYATTAPWTSGALILDGGGNPNAEWIFRIGTSMTTPAAANVILLKGASADRVFWGIGSSATFGADNAFAGNVVAQTSLTLGGGTVDGRMMAIDGLVSISTAETINVPLSETDATAEELHFLYEVNRARHDPPAWAAEHGLDSVEGGDGELVTLAGVLAQMPLALNSTLTRASRFKAQEMADNDYFAHQSEVGSNFFHPNELVRTVGYPLALQVPDPSGAFSHTLVDDENDVESIAAGFGSNEEDLTKGVNAVIALIVDADAPDLAQREHLLGVTSLSSLFVEAAAGYGVNAGSTFHNYWAFHTGVRTEPQIYLNGVVFADSNGNDLFDPGEGLPGVTVHADEVAVHTGATAVTGTAGGYSMLIPGGLYDVTCSGGIFGGPATARVPVNRYSRQVDCISGQPNPWVDFVMAPEPGALALGFVAAGALAATRRRRR